jgi:putative flippase GtrA
MKQTLPHQAIRYLIGGVTTTILCWSAVWFFVEQLSIHYMISINLGVVVVYLYSYFLNKIFVFGDRNPQHLRKSSKFVILQLTMVLSTNIIMYLTVSLLGFNYMLILMMLSVTNALVNFSMMRLVIFEPTQFKK